jgi:hypothetical protein
MINWYMSQSRFENILQKSRISQSKSVVAGAQQMMSVVTLPTRTAIRRVSQDVQTTTSSLELP